MLIYSSKVSLVSLGLLYATLFSGFLLSSSYISADDSAMDNVNITVPVSCSMSGTGMDSHNAEVQIGTYNSAIGETTVKVFCNDNEGFAIYAVGYTDNEDGKNVLTSSALGSAHDIVTGTLTSGNASQWAMKLATISSPAPTYPIIIAGSNADTLKEQDDSDFSTFQEVPDNYAKVAYRTSGTDAGANAEGATFTTTYQVYVSPTQPAGTYVGKVKYTLVHPAGASIPEPCVNNEPCIRIVVPPDKLTYMDKEEIDPTGMVIKLYNGDGTENRVINNDEVTFTSDKAEIGKTTAAIYSDGSGINALRDFCAYKYSLRRPYDANYAMFSGSDPRFMSGDKQAAIVPLGGNGGMGDNDASSMYFTIYDNKLFFSIDVPSEITVWYIREDSNSQTGWSIGGTATRFGRTFTSIGELFGFDSFDDIPVSTRNPAGVNLLTLSLVDNITQKIVVSWQDPDNGNVLTTSFDITVEIPD